MTLNTVNETVLHSANNQNKMYEYADKFNNLVASITEATGYDLYQEPTKVFRNKKALGLLEDFFVEESYDPNEFTTAEEVKDHIDTMKLQFKNDVKGLLENVTTGTMNPIIGMSTTLHKQILMNMVYDKGAIQKIVSDSPAYTITQQYRYLIDTDGNKIDMFREQNKMTAAIKKSNPFKVIDVTLPETGTTDFVSALDGTSRDRLSLSTKIVAFKISDVVFEIGDPLPNDDGYYDPNGTLATVKETKDVWFRQVIDLTPSYASNSGDRMAVKVVGATVKQDNAGTTETVEITDTITAMYDKDKNRYTITSAAGKVSGIRLKARLDASAGTLKTCQVSWDTKTIYDEIPDAIPINTTFSPDEMKDIQALYKVDQLSETMQMIKTVLLNYKDDEIKTELDSSFEDLPASNKANGQFNYCPPDNYALGHVQYIKDHFYYYFDSFITHLYQIYNDANLTVSIFGDPDMVRRTVPTEVVYNSPAKIGPVELNFFKKTSTDGNRVYQWIGSDKNRGDDEFTVVLTPTGDNKRITYRIIDYMMYIGNDVRNSVNYELPSVHAYERWKFFQYEPVQARLKILNPSGLSA